MEAEGDLPPAVALQSNLPDALGDRAYFQPAQQGDEARLRAWIDARRGGAEPRRERASSATTGRSGSPGAVRYGRRAPDHGIVVAPLTPCRRDPSA